MKNTMLLDVKLNVLPSSMRVLTNHTRLHLFTGTSEILCRAVLLDKEEIGPERADLYSFDWKRRLRFAEGTSL